MTRDAIVRAAKRLFDERGFDNVTVAEVADAANVSVKTLFVYFRSKDELVFADSRLTDDIVAAVSATAGSPAAALVEVLKAAARADEDGDGLEQFHRSYGSSAVVRAGLLRLWADLEDRLTEVLAARAGEPAAVRHRLSAIQLVGIVRSVTSNELREAVRNEPPAGRLAALDRWLTEAASLSPAAGN